MLALTMRSMPQAAVDHVESERFGDVGGRSPARAASTSSDMRPPAKPVGGEEAEHGVGVGDRGPVAAPAVAGRAGHRTGRLRARRAARPRARGRSTRRRRRSTGRRPSARRCSSGSASCGRCGPAGVPPRTRHMSKLVPPMSTARKSPTPAARAATARAHHAARGPGPEQRDRPLHDVLGRHHAAGGLHDEHRAAVAAPRAAVHEVGRVGRHAGRHVGVHQRGRRALELRPGRQHLVRQRDVLDVGELLEDQLPGAQLVRRVARSENR